MYKVLILGASGMIGHSLLVLFNTRNNFIAKGIVRAKNKLPNNFRNKYENFLYDGSDINSDMKSFILTTNIIVDIFQPDVIINAVGIIKQVKVNKISSYIKVNSLLPNVIAEQFSKYCRIIQISTDCVFKGDKGNYKEEDLDDETIVNDPYSMTKILGELKGYDNCLTIRTSVIGHELARKVSLLEWFLSQPVGSTVNGYKKVLYSGFCVTEFERILAEIIIPNKKIKGLYHVSSDPIDKYNLLKIINEVYDKKINLIEDEKIVLNRILNSEKFRKEYNYSPPSWYEMILDMYNYYMKNKCIYD